MIESFATQPLQSPPYAYLYAQYSDDANCQAFVDAYNGLAQGYQDWFLQTPLAIYTNTNISGALLDWVGNNLYGITRPILPTSSVGIGATNSYPTNSQATNSFYVQAGLAAYVTDDVYKRALTWATYLGDGKQLSLQWMRRRVARFIFGADGSDISVGELANIGITLRINRQLGPFNTQVFNRLAFNELESETPRTMTIAIQNGGSIGPIFQNLVASGMLPLPFQFNYEVTV